MLSATICWFALFVFNGPVLGIIFAWFVVNGLVLGIICLVLGMICLVFVVNGLAFVMIVQCVASFCNKKFVVLSDKILGL